MILGTGAGPIAEEIDAQVTIAYRDLPGFPRSTALGHRGQLVCGELANQKIVAMQGRFHLYEGYGASQITVPIQAMRELGVEVLLISNAAGGLNPRFSSGDLMVIESHLDLMFHPWHTISHQAAGVRSPTRVDQYDRRLIEQSLEHARREGFVLQQGVYAGLRGPTYETRAEYRFLRRVGADVVGMSTIPEVVAATNLGLRVWACSIVANLASPDRPVPTSAEDVVQAAQLGASRLSSLVKNAISRCND